MTWHMSVGILCSADPSVKAKSQVSLYASWGHLILKMQHRNTRQAKQKISANLDHHWSKKFSFFCVQTNWVCPSGPQIFCKNDSDSSRWLWLESSHSVKNVTTFLNVTLVESESPKSVTGVESSHWLESRYHWLLAVGLIISVELECLPTLSNLTHSRLLSQTVHWTGCSFTSFTFKKLQANLKKLSPTNQEVQTKRYFKWNLNGNMSVHNKILSNK